MTDRPHNVMKDDIVVLVRDIASLKLASGDIGKVLSVSGNGYEVMFPRIEGEHHLVVQTLVADDLEKAAGFTALAGPAAIGQAEALHKLQHSMYRRTYQLVKLLLGLDEEAYIDYDAESGGMTVTTHVKAPDVEQVLAERSFWTEEQAAQDYPRYTLNELLARCDPDAPMPEKVKELDRAPAAGREIRDTFEIRQPDGSVQKVRVSPKSKQAMEDAVRKYPNALRRLAKR